MARPNSGLNFNIAQLERILDERRTEVSRLERQRAELARKLDGLDRQIGKLNGGLRGMRGRIRGMGGGGRARNERSLVETLEEVMRSNGKPMRVGDIVEAVTATGYRSNSANFRGIVNQTLIKERKRFGQADRGLYELKGAGGESKSKKDKPAA
jgi:septal ring factor EnvC (AmiA/AmiB activator)